MAYQADIYANERREQGINLRHIGHFYTWMRDSAGCFEKHLGLQHTHLYKWQEACQHTENGSGSLMN